MPAGGAGGAHAYLPDRQGYLVRNDYHVVGPDLIIARGLGGGVAGQVHIGLGLHQQRLLVPDAAGAGESGKAQAVDAGAVPLGEYVACHEADVVARALVLGAGITQEHNEP